MKVTHAQGDPRSLVLLEQNARYMRHETYQRLVSNIKEDGVLQQWPFVWHDHDSGVRRVLSGNHRVRASIDAGLEVIDWTECDEPLPKDKQVAIQLSHNSIAGEDDPSVLKRLYESIEDVDERLYAGLDDETLGLLATIGTESLGEANLDFATVLLVFLPHELERATEALADAKKMSSAREWWLAKAGQHERVLDAIENAQAAYKVGNVATALDVVLDVFEAHQDEALRDGWYDEVTREARHTGWVPVATLLGSHVPAESAAIIRRGIDLLMDVDDAPGPAVALERIVADYLAGA